MVPVASTVEATLPTHHDGFGWGEHVPKGMLLMALTVCVKWQVAAEVEGSPSIRHFSSF